MIDVFISYAREDLDRIGPLVTALTRRGCRVWWDRTIPPGSRWEDVIEKALRETRCMIVLWSRASVESDWVKLEAAGAKQRKILVPALLDAVAIPAAFQSVHAVDLADWTGDEQSPEYQRLIRAVAALVNVHPARQARRVIPLVMAAAALFLGLWFQLSLRPARRLDEQLGSGLGPFRFGMSPHDVNAKLPRPLPETVSGAGPKLDEATEYREFGGGLYYFNDVPLVNFPPPDSPASEFSVLRTWKPCWKTAVPDKAATNGGKNYLVFFFRAGKLVMIAARLTGTDCRAEDEIKLLRALGEDLGIPVINGDREPGFRAILNPSRTTVTGRYELNTGIAQLIVYSHECTECTRYFERASGPLHSLALVACRR